MNLSKRTVYTLSIVSLIIASLFSIGYHQFDEHFQLLEFAGLKLGLTSVTNDFPWEYKAQIRPTLQPVIAIGVYKFLSALGNTSPFQVAFVLRLLSAGLAFFCMRQLYKVYEHEITNKILANWFLILSFLLWLTVYNGVRFSSENWSGSFFILGFTFYFLSKKKGILPFVGIGILLGLSFLFRYQSGFLIAGFVGWLLIIKKEGILKLSVLSLAVVAVIGVGVVIDKWFYGEWTFSAYNYFEQNILEDKASAFGVDPWWGYFRDFFIQGVPPFSLLFIASILLLFFFKPKSALTWTIVPFLLIHCMIGHKELRFLFPIVYFLPIVLIRGFQVVESRFIPQFESKKAVRIGMKLGLLVYLGYLVVVIFKPAEINISMYQSIYNKYDTPATLFIVTEEAEKNGLKYDFYTRNNLDIKRIKSIEEIELNPNRTQLVAFKNQLFPEDYPKKGTLIYSTFPGWMKQINVGNWMERAKLFRVYEISK